jgi:hypothetical protein
MRQFMYTVLTNQEMILEIIYGMLSPFGGRPYWHRTVAWISQGHREQARERARRIGAVA